MIPAELVASGKFPFLQASLIVKKKEVGSIFLHVGERDVCIILLNNKETDKIKHVGKELLNYAHRISEKMGKKGHLSTFATQNAHSFFYLMGFRAMNDKTNAVIEEEIKTAHQSKRKADTTKLRGTLMRNQK